MRSKILTAPYTISGINYADVWHVTLTALGMALILGGVATAVVTEFMSAHKVAIDAK